MSNIFIFETTTIYLVSNYKKYKPSQVPNTIESFVTLLDHHFNIVTLIISIIVLKPALCY